MRVTSNGRAALWKPAGATKGCSADVPHVDDGAEKAERLKFVSATDFGGREGRMYAGVMPMAEESLLSRPKNMKKLQALLLGTALVGINQAHALINDGKFGDSSELFISVYDAAAQKSYYKDLGISMVQFLNGQACFEGHLAQDPNYAGFKGKPDLVYNIAAVNPLAKDSGNLGTWGYIATSSQGGQIFNTSWNFIDNTKQKIQAYIGALNVDPFENKPGQADENRSGTFGPDDLAYHGKGSWGPSMGQSVKGNTEGKPGQGLEFYFVNNSTGADDAGKAAKLGVWTLSAAGELSYSGTGTQTVCNTIGGGTNRAPNAVASVLPSEIVGVGTPVTLDGSGSSDPDNDPLAYVWVQTSGPAAALSGDKTATASFTPAQAGTYVFELTVADGKATSQPATATVSARIPGSAEPPGPFIKINAPASLKLGQKHTITWASKEIGPKQKVKISFSANGGAKFKVLRSVGNGGVVANRKGSFKWKPKKAHLTQDGVLRLCVKPAKGAAQMCFSTKVAVLP
jgi:hypothetical protein